MKRFLLIVASIVALMFGTSPIPAQAVGLHGACVKADIRIHWATSGLPTQWVNSDTGYVPAAPPFAIYYGVPAGQWATWLGYQFYVDYNIEMPGGSRYGFRWYGVNNGASPTHSQTLNGHTCSWYGDTFTDGAYNLQAGLVIAAST